MSYDQWKLASPYDDDQEDVEVNEKEVIENQLERLDSMQSRKALGLIASALNCEGASHEDDNCGLTYGLIEEAIRAGLFFNKNP